MAVNNKLVKQEPNTKPGFSKFMSDEMIVKKVNSIIGGEKGQRFITAIVSAVSNNNALKECTNESIFSAALLGESLNLSPSPQLGHYYLVPFNKKVNETEIKVAQFQLGYKGYIQLAIRSGYYKKLNVVAIKEGELIKYDPLTEDLIVNMIEDEDLREKTPTIGYYAMYEYENGFRKTMYWSKKKMLNHADTYSKAFSKDGYEKLLSGKVKKEDMWKYSSFWYKDFDGMAFKTMLRQLISKWGIMSIDMQNAYERDMAEIKENGGYDYIDNNDSTDNDKVIIEAESTEIKEEAVENAAVNAFFEGAANE